MWNMRFTALNTSRERVPSGQSNVTMLSTTSTLNTVLVPVRSPTLTKQPSLSRVSSMMTVRESCPFPTKGSGSAS